MARPRSQLNDLLLQLAQRVYFQQPDNIQMEAPYIRYERLRRETRYADNLPYADAKGYQIFVVDRDPDSPIPDLVASLPYCSFDRHYKADDLNHDVYTIFF